MNSKLVANCFSISSMTCCSVNSGTLYVLETVKIELSFCITNMPREEAIFPFLSYSLGNFGALKDLLHL